MRNNVEMRELCFLKLVIPFEKTKAENRKLKEI